ncbi:hypothetical protein A5657_03025 [Mycobacterium kubicae]|nr:hypothetical protein A5657_03025 [Mycobacterium kubicae]
MGHHDVGRLDVAVQEALFVRIIQGAGHPVYDASDVFNGHPCRVPVGKKSRPVDTVDEVHREPQLAVFFAAVMHAHDVRMPKCGSQISLAVKPGAIIGVGRPIPGQKFQRITARKPWMLRKVDLAHSSGSQQPDDLVPGKGLTGC